MRQQKSHSVRYQQFERRSLLASITLNGSELLLGGGTGNNVGSVSISGGEVAATLKGVDSRSFAVADVETIRFVGLGGNDRFTNNTSIPSFAFGHAGNDTLIGGSGNDRLNGGTGEDTLEGNDGDDEIRGGADGTKIIDGGAGNDKLFGGAGTNTIRGGAGDDIVYGGDLMDLVFGDEGDDLLYPGHGENIVRGGDGNDTVIAGRDNDMIFGEDGNDRLYGGEGNDEINGNDGNDVVVGRIGDDVLKGGDGNDYMRGNDGDDTMLGEAGNDRLQGDRGDDTLDGGSNGTGPDEFDRILLDGVEGRYRVAGDLVTSDLVGEDGFDSTTNMEWLHYIEGEPDDHTSHIAESQIEEVITVQPIIVSNTNGSNTAEFFGTDEEERLIKRQVNDIYYQARIQVNWVAPLTWNNTFANVGSGGTRPLNDAFEIFDDAKAAGKVSGNARVINMYFIEIVPGQGNQTENQVNGVAITELNQDNNGITIQVGDNLPTFEEGRVAVARVASHEIGHNMGLLHVSGSGTNLMNAPLITSGRLTTAQTDRLVDSGFSR
jgi:hypothetical protein